MLNIINKDQDPFKQTSTFWISILKVKHWIMRLVNCHKILNQDHYANCHKILNQNHYANNHNQKCQYQVNTECL